jgi:hypothetical protein
LTRSKPFQEHLIPEIASQLAITLSQTLAPLFSQTPEAEEELTWDRYATWHDEEDEWTSRRHCLVNMFEFALQTKADLCLNIED